MPASAYQVGACETYRRILANNSLNAVVCFAGPCRFLGGTNSGTGAALIKLYNKASAPDPATDVPLYSIQASTARDWRIPEDGIWFSEGLAMLVTTDVADTGTTAFNLGANVAVVNLIFKRGHEGLNGCGD